MLIRVFKLANGELMYSAPGRRYSGGTFVNGKELSISDAKFPEITAGCEYIDVKKDFLESFNCKFDYGLFFDGEVKLENLKRDDSFEHVLMPGFMIVKKEKARIHRDLTEEIAKETPDQATMAMLNYSYNKINDMCEAEIYELALANLSRSEIPKPIIAEKIKEKIAGLKNER